MLHSIVGCEHISAGIACERFKGAVHRIRPNWTLYMAD
jgi:hypothetical protein